MDNMDIVKIKSSDKEQYLNLTRDENAYLKKFATHPIYRVDYSCSMSEKFFKRNLGKNRFFYGIKTNGSLVALIDGCIEKAPRGNVGYINDIFVMRKHRNKQYSSILKDAFFKWLKKRKIRYCQLHVLKANPAKKVYDNWGFEIDEFKMTKKI